MRPLELLMEARPIITSDGLAAIELDPRSFKALKDDINSCRISGMYPDQDAHLTPRDTMRYNGTLYVRAKGLGRYAQLPGVTEHGPESPRARAQ